MILEGIVTTIDDDGALNVAPMGPRIDDGMDRFVLRLFRSSRTFHNLEARREGVLHVTDDVLLFARAVIGKVGHVDTRPAAAVRGRILIDSSRYYEFKVVSVDHAEERAEFHAETVERGRFRDLFGFNRAKHAVIEAAILATRIGILPMREIVDPLRPLGVMVVKTGGPREREAFELLRDHIEESARRGDAMKDGAAP